MGNMDTVYGFAGHSIVPTLALIHSKIAHRYVFMFTEELSENKLMFERYLKQKIWRMMNQKLFFTPLVQLEISQYISKNKGNY